MADEALNRVQLAASHWKPRFVANGIDVNDFERVLASTTEWKDWGPNWMRTGDMHRELGDEAARSKRMVSSPLVTPMSWPGVSGAMIRKPFAVETLNPSMA